MAEIDLFTNKFAGVVTAIEGLNISGDLGELADIRATNMGTLTVGGNVINDVWATETLGEVTVSGQLQSLIRCKNNTAGITVASTGPAAGIKMTPGTCSGPVNVFGNLELLAIDTLEAPVAISGDRLQ